MIYDFSLEGPRFFLTGFKIVLFTQGDLGLEEVNHSRLVKGLKEGHRYVSVVAGLA